MTREQYSLRANCHHHHHQHLIKSWSLRQVVIFVNDNITTTTKATKYKDFAYYSCLPSSTHVHMSLMKIPHGCTRFMQLE